MALTTIKTGGLADNSVTDAKVANAITVTGAQTGITQVGTISAGTWQGTPITSAYLNAAQTAITSVGTLSSLTLGGDLLVPQYIRHVGDTDSCIEFDTDEIDYYLGELELAQAWIMKQTQSYYDIELEIIDDFFDTTEEVIYVPNIDWGRTSYDIKNIVAQELGFDNIDEYLEFYNFDKDKYKVIVLCFVKQDA